MDFEHFVSLPEEDEQEQVEPSENQEISLKSGSTSLPETSSIPLTSAEDIQPLNTIIPPRAAVQKRPTSQPEVSNLDLRPAKSIKTTGTDKGKDKMSFRRAKDDYFTLLLPKSVLKMPRTESSEMVRAIATREDAFQTREFSINEMKEWRD